MHSPGELLRQSPGFHELKLLEQGFACRYEIVDPVGRGDELEVLPDRQGVEQLGVVGDVSQARLAAIES